MPKRRGKHLYITGPSRGDTGSLHLIKSKRDHDAFVVVKIRHTITQEVKEPAPSECMTLTVFSPDKDDSLRFSVDHQSCTPSHYTSCNFYLPWMNILTACNCQQRSIHRTLPPGTSRLELTDLIKTGQHHFASRSI